MLRVAELSAGYPGKQVLSGLSMTAPAGQVTALLGPNGCGKSTLLKAVAGILPPSAGEICWQDRPLSAMPQRQRARTVAYLSQGRQIPDITVERLVLHGRFPYLQYPRRYRPEDLAVARRAMETMGLLELAQTPVAQLSGGQRQKVYIAMALAQDAPVLLLDEPTTYLDIAHQLQLMAQAKALSRMGKAVVMVVHDIPAALETADQIVLLEQGRTVLQAVPEEACASGQIGRVFGVTVEQVQTAAGCRYFCR